MLANETRQTFIKTDVAFKPDGLMQHFVDDRIDQKRIVIGEHTRQDGVVKIAQGTIGPHTPQIGIIPLLFQSVLLLQGIVFIKKPLIWHAAQDRKAPYVWFEGI